MLVRLTYLGQYDYALAVTVEADGGGTVERGSYVSHSPQRVRLDAETLDRLGTLLAQIAPATYDGPPEAEGFRAELRTPEVTATWWGPKPPPEAGRALREAVALLRGIGR